MSREGSGVSARIASWLPVLLAGVVAVAAAVAWVWAVSAGPRPPFLDEAPAQAPARRSPAPDGVLDLAGSGSNLPVTRALARAFEARTSIPTRVHASVGSSGGERAVWDGVVDIGLLSRPLSERLADGLVQVPYGRTPVSLVAHPKVPVSGVSGAELVAIVSGERTAWPDGTPVAFRQREPGDSSHALLAAKIAGFAEADARAYARRLWRVVLHDDEMRAAVADSPGALGLFAEGEVRDPDLKALAIDGVAPTLGNLASGRYPFGKPLFLVVQEPLQPEVARFVAFVGGPEGQAVLRAAGVLPVKGAAGVGRAGSAERGGVGPAEAGGAEVGPAGDEEAAEALRPGRDRGEPSFERNQP